MSGGVAASARGMGTCPPSMRAILSLATASAFFSMAILNLSLDSSLASWVVSFEVLVGMRRRLHLTTVRTAAKMVLCNLASHKFGEPDNIATFRSALGPPFGARFFVHAETVARSLQARKRASSHQDTPGDVRLTV